MIQLSLNKAAKEAGVAKATLLEALKSGRLSASKSEKGHWEIDPSELFRVFPKTGSKDLIEPNPTPHENHVKTTQNGALEVEVKMLREQLALVSTERERENGNSWENRSKICVTKWNDKAQTTGKLWPF